MIEVGLQRVQDGELSVCLQGVLLLSCSLEETHMIPKATPRPHSGHAQATSMLHHKTDQMLPIWWCARYISNRSTPPCSPSMKCVHIFTCMWTVTIYNTHTHTHYRHPPTHTHTHTTDTPPPTHTQAVPSPHSGRHGLSVVHFEPPSTAYRKWTIYPPPHPAFPSP